MTQPQLINPIEKQSHDLGTIPFIVGCSKGCLLKDVYLIINWIIDWMGKKKHHEKKERNS